MTPFPFGPGEGRLYQGPSGFVSPPAMEGDQTVEAMEAPVPFPNVGDGEMESQVLSDLLKVTQLGNRKSGALNTGSD